MSERRDARVEEELRRLRAPDEDGALERAVLLATVTERPLAGAARRSGRRRRRAGVLAGLCALLGGLLVLTPAGAEVTQWVGDVVTREAPKPRSALTGLPTGGRLLATSSGGAWIVEEDGSRRRLGDYDQATFSPRGLFVAAGRENVLSAVNPEGDVQWSISRPGAIEDPRWAPSGYRVAFRDGAGLSVVAGDGTDPRRLAGNVVPAAPSWRPPAAGADPRYEPNVLTFLDATGSVSTIDVDASPVRELWRRTPPPSRAPRAVAWAGPDRLVVSSRQSVRVFDRHGRATGSVPIPDGARVESMVSSPDGERLAIVLRDASAAPDARSRLYLARIAGGERQRTVFSGFGRFGAPSFSPDGEWILLPWRDTDQWLFIAPSEDRKLVRRVIAVGDVARQFDPGGTGPARYPEVSGWCCG